MNVTRPLGAVALAALLLGSPLRASAASQPLAVGDKIPSFSYRLLDGHRLSPKTLRGKRYVLWMVASWCSSCQAGSSVVGDHIAYLRSRGVSVVELRLANDLGAPGPGLQQFQKAVGTNANAPNWYWGELSEKQTLAVDSKGYPDIYYLVNADGTIAQINGNPAGTWDTIASFAAAPMPTAQTHGKRHASKTKTS
ncbi:MAG: hypothetical protein NVS4B5_19330 [Vulcanimicrobiaceae bacterium]